MVVERHLSADKHVKHDAKTPYVHLWARVDLRVQELRSGEIKGATEGGKMRKRFEEVREAEIDDLDVPRLRNEDIFDFEIPMDDVIAMAVVEGAADLSRELTRHAFPETTVANDVVQHLPAVDVLEDHVVVIGVDDKLAHSTDVRMMEEHGECGFTDGPNFL